MNNFENFYPSSPENLTDRQLLDLLEKGEELSPDQIEKTLEEIEKRFNKENNLIQKEELNKLFHTSKIQKIREGVQKILEENSDEEQ